LHLSGQAVLLPDWPRPVKRLARGGFVFYGPAPRKSQKSDSGMAIYLVSFNLTRNHTYSNRLDHFMAELQRGPWWAETGALVVVEAPEAIDAFCDRLLAPWCFDEQHDMAVVFDLAGGEARSKGRLRDFNLFDIVPWMKRV
jgi:hypothetical protein